VTVGASLIFKYRSKSKTTSSGWEPFVSQTGRNSGLD